MILLPRRKTFLDVFPAPEILLMSSVGISITDSHIKFIELKREIFGRGLKLAHSEIIDLPKGLVESGVINDPDKLTSLLKKISDKYRVRYAYATLPEEKAYLFTTTIKDVPLEGIRDAIAFVVEENVPLALADALFDYQVINEDKEKKEMKLAVSVLPRNIVDSYVNVFESAGIVPVSFDIESQAIARALIHKGDKRAHLIVNISSRKSGLYVVEDEVVQFSITPAYGYGEDDSYLGLIDLKAEIRKVFAFWNSKKEESNKEGDTPIEPVNSEKKIEKIILCGSGAQKKDFVKRLMDESEIKYVLADVWVNTSPSRNYAPHISFEESLSYAPAVGVILSKTK